MAQYNLAVLYANGQGVPQDYVEARKWYRKAAEQGDAAANLDAASVARAQKLSDEYFKLYVEPFQ